MYFNKFHVPKIQQNLLKLNNYRLLFVENSKLVTLTYFLISFVYKKVGQSVQFFGLYGFAKSDLYEMAFRKTIQCGNASHG